MQVPKSSLMGLYYDFSGLCLTVGLPCKEPAGRRRRACTQLPRPWCMGHRAQSHPHQTAAGTSPASWAARVAEHTHKSGCCHIYTPRQVLQLLLNSASARLLWTLTLESGLEKNAPHPEGGRWMRNNEKSFRILWHWYYRKKEDDRRDMHVLGRRQLPSCLTDTPMPILPVLLTRISLLEGKQWTPSDQREKRGVSEESKHSCENCHSYLGNWNIFHPRLNDDFQILIISQLSPRRIHVHQPHLGWGNKTTVNCTE